MVYLGNGKTEVDAMFVAAVFVLIVVVAAAANELYTCIEHTKQSKLTWTSWTDDWMTDSASLSIGLFVSLQLQTIHYF